MDNDIITFMDNENNIHKYKILLTMDNQYIIYTDINNNDANKDIHVSKVDSLDTLNVIDINDDELNEIENKYLEIIE